MRALFIDDYLEESGVVLLYIILPGAYNQNCLGGAKPRIIWACTREAHAKLGGGAMDPSPFSLVKLIYLCLYAEFRSRPILGGSGSDPSKIKRLLLLVNCKAEIYENSFYNITIFDTSKI